MCSSFFFHFLWCFLRLFFHFFCAWAQLCCHCCPSRSQKLSILHLQRWTDRRQRRRLHRHPQDISTQINIGSFSHSFRSLTRSLSSTHAFMPELEHNFAAIQFHFRIEMLKSAFFACWTFIELKLIAGWGLFSEHKVWCVFCSTAALMSSNTRQESVSFHHFPIFAWLLPGIHEQWKCIKNAEKIR